MRQAIYNSSILPNVFAPILFPLAILLDYFPIALHNTTFDNKPVFHPSDMRYTHPGVLFLEPMVLCDTSWFPTHSRQLLQGFTSGALDALHAKLNVVTQLPDLCASHIILPQITLLTSLNYYLLPECTEISLTSGTP